MTLIAEGYVPDEVYESVRQQFTEQELVNLTLTVIAINGWNRLAISFRTVPEPTSRQWDSRPGHTSSLPTLLLYMIAS